MNKKKLFSNKKVYLVILITVCTSFALSRERMPDEDDNIYHDVIIKKQIKTAINEKEKNNKLANQLPSERQQKAQLSVQESLDYLKTHQQELENILLELIRQQNADKIKLLLPIYNEFSSKDMSIIDWGNAIIYEDKNDYKNAIRLYRKMNSAMPNVKTLRFHMANALFRDKQYEAAKLEFEKLRSEDISTGDKSVINDYLNVINNSDSWSFGANLVYLNDKNLNNVPEGGANLVTPNGIIVVDTKPESGQGVSYSFSAEKRYSLSDNYFAGLNFYTTGKYYWDNHKYNELLTGTSFGLGYADAQKELEFSPFFNNRLYANVKDEGDDLSQYYKTFGVSLNGSYWINQNFRYSAALSLGRDKFIESYNHLNGNDISLSNNLLYMPNQSRYFLLGLDVSTKNTVYDNNSYNKIGISGMWSESWRKGFSTNVGASFSKTNYKGTDIFIPIKREDKVLNVDVSLWNRNIHYLGITPRLSYHYERTKSNHTIYNYDKHNFFLEFSKTF